jgi:hypothetical protein
MWWLDFAAVALAAGALVDAWLVERGLFEELLDKIAAWGTIQQADRQEDGRLRWSAWWRNKLAYGLHCAFCLSYHTAFWLLLLFYLPSLWLSPPWDVVCKLPIYSLAATRLSLIIDAHASTDGTV